MDIFFITKCDAALQRSAMITTNCNSTRYLTIIPRARMGSAEWAIDS